MPEPEVCSKCKQHPRAYPESTNPWCKRCLATYKGEYSESRLAMERGKGFAAGVEAMVQTLAQEFARHPAAMVTCSEVASVILAAPRPRAPA